MEVEFITQGKVVVKRRITEKIQVNLNSFSIPISIYSDNNDNSSSPLPEFLNKKTDRKALEESVEDKNSDNTNTNNINDINIDMIRKNNIFSKKKKYQQNYTEESEEDNEEEESEEYEESENEMDEEKDDSDINNKNNSDYYDNSISNSNNNSNSNLNKLKGDSSESSSKNTNTQRLLRKYGNISEKDSEYYGLGTSGNKKIKKELTEEEIAKKTEQARLRKLHAKKLIEEEKREAVERILNEDGRKLRERQKKHNEEMKKKSKLEEEKMKKNLTKIITKYNKDGKIYVRFPQGFLLPTIFHQQKKVCKPICKCHIEGCQNLRKYTDPKTGLPYCSVDCFKKLRTLFP